MTNGPIEHAESNRQPKPPRLVGAAYRVGIYSVVACAVFSCLMYAQIPTLDQSLGIGFTGRGSAHGLLRLAGLRVILGYLPGLFAVAIAIGGVAQTYATRRTVSPEAARQWVRKAWIAILPPVIAIVLFGALPEYHIGQTRILPRVNAIRCRSNLKHISVALQSYVYEHGVLPPPDRWNDLVGIGKDECVCPAAASANSVGCTYALNEAVAGREWPGATRVLVFEKAGAAWNQSGGADQVPERPIHGRGYYFLLSDMSVVHSTRDGLPTLQW